MTLNEKWRMNMVLPPFWVTLRAEPNRKIVITRLVIEAEKPIKFYDGKSLIPYDENQEVVEIGHLPSSRLRVKDS